MTCDGREGLVLERLHCAELLDIALDLDVWFTLESHPPHGPVACVIARLGAHAPRGQYSILVERFEQNII